MDNLSVLSLRATEGGAAILMYCVIDILTHIKMQGTEVSVPCMMVIWLKDPRLYAKW